MLTITVIPTDELTDEEADDFPSDCWVLCVKHEGKVIATESDAIEPEDATFARDLKWIPDLLQTVYELGKQDGRKEL